MFSQDKFNSAETERSRWQIVADAYTRLWDFFWYQLASSQNSFGDPDYYRHGGHPGSLALGLADGQKRSTTPTTPYAVTPIVMPVAHLSLGN